MCDNDYFERGLEFAILKINLKVTAVDNFGYKLPWRLNFKEDFENAKQITSSNESDSLLSECLCFWNFSPIKPFRGREFNSLTFGTFNLTSLLVFPLKKWSVLNNEHSDVQLFKKWNVIFVPGNEVPYYLRGFKKVQVFSWFAGRKGTILLIASYLNV